MKTKTFDCVEMKRAAALRIYEETKSLSLEERQAYWRAKHDNLTRKLALRKQALEK
ncbi:MAG: hypothetical protein WC655_19445 [Candidatus Hydrogenedentales bacterium]|jgi:hypothetical protein